MELRELRPLPYPPRPRAHGTPDRQHAQAEHPAARCRMSSEGRGTPAMALYGGPAGGRGPHRHLRGRFREGGGRGNVGSEWAFRLCRPAQMAQPIPLGPCRQTERVGHGEPCCGREAYRHGDLRGDEQPFRGWRGLREMVLRPAMGRIPRLLLALGGAGQGAEHPGGRPALNRTGLETPSGFKLGDGLAYLSPMVLRQCCRSCGAEPLGEGVGKPQSPCRGGCRSGLLDAT
jgi:hypothetical protein